MAGEAGRATKTSGVMMSKTAITTTPATMGFFPMSEPGNLRLRNSKHIHWSVARDSSPAITLGWMIPSVGHALRRVSFSSTFNRFLGDTMEIDRAVAISLFAEVLGKVACVV